MHALDPDFQRDDALKGAFGTPFVLGVVVLVVSMRLTPMALSALGGSSAASIRQAVKRDARGVILDDMDREDDGGQRQIREVLRLMRLASFAG